MVSIIKDTHWDRKFKKIMDIVNYELNVDMKYTAKEEHVPKADRNNRAISERIHLHYHNLTYKYIPKVMLR